MGLWSSIKKGFKKVWKGTTKIVKKVAKGVKKVAKGVVTAFPGGKALWKAGGKIGKAVLKGIGKLGPVGIIGLQIVLASTGIGAAASGWLSSMWSGFGNMAATAAASGSAITSTLGSVGSAIYNGVNWVGGTLGAVGDAIVKGGSEVVSGNFSAGLKAFTKNMTSALTGEAGSAAVTQGIANASALGSSEALARADVITQGQAQMSPVDTTPEFLKNATNTPNVPAAPTSPSGVPTYGEALQNVTQLAPNGVRTSAVNDYMVQQGVTQDTSDSLTKDLLKKAGKSLLSGGSTGSYDGSSYIDGGATFKNSGFDAASVVPEVQAVAVGGVPRPQGYSLLNPKQFA